MLSTGYSCSILMKFEFSPQISNFMKISPVVADLFHADRRTERNDDVIVAFRNFTNAPKGHLLITS